MALSKVGREIGARSVWAGWNPYDTVAGADRKRSIEQQLALGRDSTADQDDRQIRLHPDTT
jgi:hypothetical protein